MRIASTHKASPELWQKVRQHGIIRIIVDLNLPVHSEARISREEQHSQRRAIAETQDMLVAELAGTKYEPVRLLTTVPAIGLHVGPDALAVLERSTLVKKITEDQAIKSDLEINEQK
jgi:hypothetical protein